MYQEEPANAPCKVFLIMATPRLLSVEFQKDSARMARYMYGLLFLLPGDILRGSRVRPNATAKVPALCGICFVQRRINAVNRRVVGQAPRHCIRFVTPERSRVMIRLVVRTLL